jgi:hypothetical protein
VYLNDGNGFASTPTAWTLPSLGTCGFSQGTIGNLQLGNVAYSTLDMNGDGKPDLVITRTATLCSAPVTGWQVYVDACQ